MTPEQRVAVVGAIRSHRKLQLGYRRRDGSLSLHTVAPVDLQMGNRAGTESTEYLWAYCFAEEKAELHACERILSVRALGESFEPADVLGRWPDRWTLPNDWAIDRIW